MGRDAADLAAGGDRADKVVSRAKEQLNRVFGPEAEEQIASEEHVAWGAEEWTRHEGGDHSEPPPRFGHPALRTELYRGRLILAGTETEDEHGHMEGAAKSGLRAANAILSALSSTEKEL